MVSICTAADRSKFITKGAIGREFRVITRAYQSSFASKGLLSCQVIGSIYAAYLRPYVNFSDYFRLRLRRVRYILTNDEVVIHIEQQAHNLFELFNML